MPETAPTARPPRDDKLFGPLNVLVVDDMPAIRRMLRQMLQHLGVRGAIEEANDGQEAWEILQHRAFELVVCDINMPRMYGLELRRRFRAESHHGTIPFLMITGEVTEEIVAAAAESEVDGYLLKPFKINALESRPAGHRQQSSPSQPGRMPFPPSRQIDPPWTLARSPGPAGKAPRTTL